VEQDRRFLNWEEILVVVDFRSWDGNRFHIRATRKGPAAQQCLRVPESCSNQRQQVDSVAADRDQPALAASRRCQSILLGTRWGAWRMAASENLELACLQLEDNRACH